MVEDYQQAISVANLGGIRDVQGLYSQLGLKNPPQVPLFYLFGLYLLCLSSYGFMDAFLHA